MTKEDYKKAYFKYCEETGYIADEEFELTDPQVKIVEEAEVIFSVEDENDDNDGLLKILNGKGEVLFSYGNTWDDGYRPYMVNAIDVTKRQIKRVDGVVVDGTKGFGRYYDVKPKIKRHERIW